MAVWFWGTEGCRFAMDCRDLYANVVVIVCTVDISRLVTYVSSVDVLSVWTAARGTIHAPIRFLPVGSRIRTHEAHPSWLGCRP